MFTESKYNQFISVNNKDILYNFLTSAMIEIEKSKFYEILSGQNYKDDDLILLNKFGFITQEEYQLEEIYKSYIDEKYLEDHINLTIELTNSCNFRCKYCYQDHLTNMLNIEKSNIIIKFINEKIKSGIKSIHIHWFGGEPTLNIEQAFYLDKSIRKTCLENDVGYSASMTTNGYKIKEKYSILKEMHIDSFQITLDGLDEHHNFTRHLQNGEETFNVIFNNVKFLDKQGYEIILRFNVNKFNYKIEPYIKFLIDNKLSKNVKLHIQGTNKFENSLDIDNMYFKNTQEYSSYLLHIYNILIKYNLSIPKYRNSGTNCPFDCMNNYYINSNLELLRCSSCDNSQDSKLGYLKVDKVIINDKAVDIKDKYIGFNKDKCLECKVLPICKGGCNLKYNLNIDECIPEKYFIKDYVRLLYEEAEKI